MNGYSTIIVIVEEIFNYGGIMFKNDYSCDCNIIHQDRVDDVLQSMPSDKTFLNLAELYKLIGDTTRCRILFALDKNEMCVCDIANVLNMTKSAVSHQLAVLRKSNIVKCRRSGKEVYYTLDDDHINKLFEIGLEHIYHEEEK
mgnify:FL=1